jgi:hypothetical protein
VRSLIQGNPKSCTGVITASAFGSRIVGGTGNSGFGFCGSIGRTIWIDERGANSPVVVGICIRPPPLLLPRGGNKPLRILARSFGLGNVFSVPSGWSGLSTIGGFATSNRINPTNPACVSNEKLWACAGRFDLSNFSK